ncbi:TonB family protein [Hansschlegelia plantiphila]|uniref:TonB family protein n=1 Tax=Hansschlegelia plantiphila TaxID=374655 RepID=A0A9W6J2Y1_9HYPH|nr:TonB family protein [Hansschlegelia plantiphila]GLK68748.1 hypothetical protein GCM10008179_23860 [Hansschlegelia plantiphila]
MAAVDALSLGPDPAGGDWRRWAAGGALALAFHIGALILLRETPEPTGDVGLPAIEMDLTPPPSGAAQMQEAGANAEQIETDPTPTTEPDQTEEVPPEAEQLEEIQDEATPPEEPAVTAEAAPTDDVQDLEPVETPEVAADDVKTPDDVQAAVSLPPERTVVAQEEAPERPKRPAKAAPKREAPNREPREKPTDRPTSKRKLVNSQAGGMGGASNNSGASSAAAAANYGSRVRSALAAQKRSGTRFEGRATVVFTLNRAGRVSGISASGPPEAAAEAEAMARRASFPAMPPEMQRASETYRVPITFSVR